MNNDTVSKKGERKPLFSIQQMNLLKCLDVDL